MEPIDHQDITKKKDKVMRQISIASLLFLFAVSLSVLFGRHLNNFFSASNIHKHIIIGHANSTTVLASGNNVTQPSASISAASSLFPISNNKINEDMISDCCCTFQTIDETNTAKVYPLLQRIVSTPFFAHFKIDLCSECKLWDDAPLCMLRDCGVCECEAPPVWAEEVDWIPKEHHQDGGGVDSVEGSDCGHVDDQVVTMVDSHVTDSWMTSTVSSTSYLFKEETKTVSNEVVEEDRAVVVDLRLNPERYTGYSGQSAEKVWTAIHQDNCFQQDNTNTDDGGNNSTTGYCTLPTEQRVYNRIISGMHSSISLHIAHSYCLEMDTDRIAECKTWGPNATLARERVLDHKDRLENLYVVFAVMLRAVQKAGSAITAAVPVEDPYFAESLAEWTNNLQPEITKMMTSCPPTFDETRLFDEDMGDVANTEGNMVDIQSKRLELKRRFQHLLQIMECVGCDRCKLWGSLQTLGVGTALRIILDDGDEESEAINLSRQEAVALVHTLERFSSALVYAHDFEKALE